MLYLWYAHQLRQENRYFPQHLKGLSFNNTNNIHLAVLVNTVCFNQDISTRCSFHMTIQQDSSLRTKSTKYAWCYRKPNIIYTSPSNASKSNKQESPTRCLFYMTTTIPTCERNSCYTPAWSLDPVTNIKSAVNLYRYWCLFKATSLITSTK